MAERSDDGGPKEGGEEAAFSFMDKVRFMMYGEQEKEAFLIEKKEKEEKKKAKQLEKAKNAAEKEKKTVFGKIKDFVSGSGGPSADEDKPVPKEHPKEHGESSAADEKQPEAD